MTSIEKNIFSELNSHYPQEISFLRADSPFVFLVTVILSASSTDKRAQEASDELFSIYPTPEELAKAEEDDIERIIHPVGLARSKAKNIKAMSGIIAKNKSIPDTLEDLMKLPGVGEKTASCYLATILGKPAVIADIHFVRVAKRLGLIASDDRNKAAKEIRERFPEELWYRISMTVNLHGRVVCRPRPKCDECFLSQLCPSRENKAF